MVAATALNRLDEEQREGLLAAAAVNLSNRLPMLYCVVLVNVMVLTMGFRGVAPPLLSVWLPTFFVVAICARIIYWLPANARQRPHEQRRRDVLRLPFAGTLLALSLAAWALTLYGYGSATQQALVHYTTAITCFTGVLGLTHSPTTAVAMAVSVMMPSSIVFLEHQHVNSIPIVGLQLSVSVLLIMVTRGHHRDFVSLELSRQDLAKRERESSELAQRNHLQATQDPLTGVMNRRGILERFGDELIRPGASPPWLALMDLDGFKLINDTYGHAAGDAVLCAVAERITQNGDHVAFGRLGGDEFAIVLPGELDRDQARTVLERIVAAVVRPIPFGERMLAIRASIGLHRCAGSDVSACLERADLALYKAKEMRSAWIGEFTAADEQVMRDKRAITRVFTSANFEHQLSLVYQPIIDCDANRTIGFEALARWSPDGTDWLPPHDFIQLAETTGRMSELTAEILTKALKECPAWHHGCSLNVNLSARDVLRENAATWIAGLVYAADAPYNRVVFEITESALIKDFRRAADNLGKLRQMGFRIALDDFGTGQSSLSHVHELPLDHIKIDQIFARDMARSDGSRAIVGSIVALARQLRLECIIEGIESAEQQAAARALGVRFMQGYHFSRPIKALVAMGGLVDFDRLTVNG